MKKGKIVLYVLVALLVLLVGYLVYNYFTKYYGVSNNEVNINTNTLENEITNEVENIVNMVTYNDYFYVLPDNVHYDIITDGNKLHLYNNDDKWGATIRLIDKTKYEDVFDNNDKLTERVKNSVNGEVKNIKNSEVDGVIINSFEIYTSTANSLLAYMPAYDNYEYEILLFAGDDKEINYDALNIVTLILKMGKKAE